MTNLIYIGGFGHSGSTLLEYLMTGSPALAACGEIAEARRAEAATRLCSCGKPVPECPVWRFLADPSLGVAQWSHESLATRMLGEIGARYAAMTDSSKTAWHAARTPFALKRELGRDFQLVHIIRDPRAVCWSLLKRERRIGLRSNDALLAIKTMAGWAHANLACELFRRKYPDQYVRVRYEDLAGDPVAVMTGLMAKIMPSAAWDFAAIGSQDNRHQLYANRMRSQALLLGSIKLDDRWTQDMPRLLQRLVELLTWPLRRRYGYT